MKYQSATYLPLNSDPQKIKNQPLLLQSNPPFTKVQSDWKIELIPTNTRVQSSYLHCVLYRGLGGFGWAFYATNDVVVVEVLIKCLLFGPWWVWTLWLRQRWRRTEKVNWFSLGKLKKGVKVSKGVKAHWVPNMAWHVHGSKS